MPDRDIKVLAYNLLRSKYGGVIILLLHISFSIFIYFVLSFFGFIKGHPANYNLIQWDAGWYLDIVKNGYSFTPGSPSNTNFFPLFPIIWRVTHFSPWMISVLNLAFTFSGFLILKNTFKFNYKELFIMLSIPSIFFCYVPFSEGVFFLSGSILLYGLKKDFNFAMLGLFMLGLSRSISIVFIPIVIFSLLYNLLPNKVNNVNKKLWVQSSMLILISLVSVLVSQLIQYAESGTFFTLFETQKEWSRVFNWPELYLTTWDSTRLIWLDGLAFFSGVAAIIICGALLIRKFKNTLTTIASPILLSIAYVAVITIVIIIYSPKDNNGGTSLLAMNRYIFSTPFFMVLLFVIFKNWSINKLTLFKFSIVSLIVWPLFNAHGFLFALDHFYLPHFKTKIYFGAIILYSFFFFLTSRKALQNTIWSGLYVFNVIIQMYLFNRYLHSEWIG